MVAMTRRRMPFYKSTNAVQSRWKETSRGITFSKCKTELVSIINNTRCHCDLKKLTFQEALRVYFTFLGFFLYILSVKMQLEMNPAMIYIK